MNKKLIIYAAAIFAAFGAVNAQADTIGLTAITVNGDKMVNDSVLDVTWADVLSGNGSWNSANSWITSLNNANYGGHNDWRMPTASMTATSYGSGLNFAECNPDSLHEIGCLFFNELEKPIPNSIYGIPNNTPIDTLPFENVVYGEYYWTGTLVSGYRDMVYVFNPFHVIHTTDGFMNNQLDPYGNSLRTMAVRTGQTLEAPPPVTPIPASLWLLVSSIGGLGVFARKRTA